MWALYALFAAAVLLETSFGSVTYADDIGANLPFFEDISTWTHVKGISFSLAEASMALLLLGLLLKVLSARAVRFDRGSLLRPLGLYLLMVLVGEVHGLVSGGNTTTSLWEVRGQVYIIAAYVLTCNLVTTRRQVNALVWILLLGTGLKGIQGVIRYQIELGGNVHSVEALFPHEQSFFFNAFLTLTAILFLYGGSRRMKTVALFFLPFVVVSNLANQRRAATLALIVGMAALLLVTALAHPRRRRTVIAIVALLAVAWPPYYAAFKNSTGLTGQIAHAVASNNNPNARDASSNLYRINEDADIMATMKSTTTSALIGYGYGKPMFTPYPLANISGTYIFWNIMPHNSILWIWMRLGTIGYLIFLSLMGMAIAQATGLVRRLRDPALKGLALWSGVMVMQQVIFGYLDLGMVNDRNLITLGVLFSLIGRLATFARREEDDTAGPGDEPPPEARRTWTRRPDLPRGLAIAGGRLVRAACAIGAPWGAAGLAANTMIWTTHGAPCAAGLPVAGEGRARTIVRHKKPQCVPVHERRARVAR